MPILCSVSHRLGAGHVVRQRYNSLAPYFGVATGGQADPSGRGLFPWGNLGTCMLKLSTPESMALLSDRRLHRTDLLVFAAIAVWKTNRPSRKRISLKCGMTFPNITRAIKRLVEFGYLTVQEEEGQTNTYAKGTTLTSIRRDTRITGETSLIELAGSPVSPVRPKLLRALQQEHQHTDIVK